MTNRNSYVPDGVLNIKNTVLHDVVQHVFDHLVFASHLRSSGLQPSHHPLMLIRPILTLPSGEVA